jgi:proton-translocating NAD(P)+ transhydrogenase subunit alpha
MKLGVPKETFPGERRVAIVPAVLPALKKLGIDVGLERGAGEAAGFPDSAYGDQVVFGSRQEVFEADIVAQVRTPGANPAHGAADVALMRRGQAIIGFAEPLTAVDAARAVADRGAMLFAMELVPRITRAQSMDALSSMATICGYKAVLIAADTVPRMFPMMTTAAGTITPARVLIIGAGVAGLQAIATARRLGAVVSSYDVRPAAKEQVQSLGARFVELPLEAQNAQDARGYATAQDESFYAKQRELLGNTVAESDVVITTAVVPGKKSPVLVTKEMVARMAPGSVIVDLASERGGNCELTRSGEVIDVNGVKINGTINLASSVPYHASQMYSRNLNSFLLHLAKGGELKINVEDEITRETLLTRGGELVNERVRQFFGLPSLVKSGT